MCPPHYTDSISRLNLSTRSYNALIREGIHTIDKLLSCSKDNIMKLRNLGAKSLEEIFNVIDRLNANKSEIYSEDKIGDKLSQRTFIGHNGLKYFDIAIEDLELNVRAFNCLKTTGINYYSQLINKTEEELIAIPNMGRKTLLELEQIKETVQPIKCTEESKQSQTIVDVIGFKIFSSISEKTNINPVELFKALEQAYLNYVTEKDIISDTKDILKDEIFMKSLYENIYMKSIINEYILDVIRENNYGCDEPHLLDKMPDCFKYAEILNKSLNDLLNNNDINLLYDDRFVAIYDSFVIGAKNYLNDKEYDVLRQRIIGKTLEDVGITKAVTRERIRQIEAKAIKKLNNSSAKFKEDIYSDIFNRYAISREDFVIAFNDDEAYQYLSLRYGDTSEKDSQKKALENILHDKDIPLFFKKAFEKAIYKNYVKIGNEYISCTRNSISNYVLKNYGISDISFEEYCEIYFSILKDIDKISDPKLAVMDRGYENKLALCNTVLWKYGKKFRYYNIDSYDYMPYAVVGNWYQFHRKKSSCGGQNLLMNLENIAPDMS